MAIKSVAVTEASFQLNSTSYTVGTQLSGEILPVSHRLDRSRPQFVCSKLDVKWVKEIFDSSLGNWGQVSHGF
jgi:hypothetical protein